MWAINVRVCSPGEHPLQHSQGPPGPFILTRPTRRTDTVTQLNTSLTLLISCQTHSFHTSCSHSVCRSLTLSHFQTHTHTHTDFPPRVRGKHALVHQSTSVSSPDLPEVWMYPSCYIRNNLMIAPISCLWIHMECRAPLFCPLLVHLCCLQQGKGMRGAQHSLLWSGICLCLFIWLFRLRAYFHTVPHQKWHHLWWFRTRDGLQNAVLLTKGASPVIILNHILL